MARRQATSQPKSDTSTAENPADAVEAQATQTENTGEAVTETNPESNESADIPTAAADQTDPDAATAPDAEETAAGVAEGVKDVAELVAEDAIEKELDEHPADTALIEKISADVRAARDPIKHAALAAIESALHELRAKVIRGMDHIDEEAIALLKKVIGG